MDLDVELELITKSFGDHVAVDAISFAVPQGRFFSLLGPSGCGKSTTLRMISGFEQPDAGALRIAGEDMSGVPPYRRPTNMVFQRWALFPHMTVFDNVAFGPSVARTATTERRRRVLEALELVGLTAFADRKPGQLSGGQMQRVALARALINRPKVLLLDEPLGALDLKLRTQMQLELKRIQKEVGTTFVYVTHDQGEAMTMSDQIAVMNDARIEQIGAPADVYDRPATRFVADFIGNTNLLPVRIVENSGGTAKVTLGDAALTVPVAAGSTGSTGVISVRYEQVRLGKAPLDLDFSGTARIRETIFTGSVMQYVLEPQGFVAEVVAEIPHSGSEAQFGRDEQVHIGWSAAAAPLFGDG